MRLLHILVICALVAAAAYVYEIKFESTLQAERLAKLRMEIRRERDAIATLRAEWAKLDSPARIQGLAQRHLKLKPVDATQIDNFDKLPARPQETPPQDIDDPIGAIIEQDGDIPTGSVRAPEEAR
jgi:cell division protein FtsL